MTEHGRLRRSPERASDVAGQGNRATPLPWFQSIRLIRRLCCVWLAMIGWLLFQPMPSRAQPEAARTAMKPVSSMDPAEGPAEKAPEEVPTGATNSRHRDAAPPKLLVLKNGRLVDGRISQNAGGYLVEKPNGSLLVPFDRVSFEAQDRSDAYRKIRATLPADSTASFLALARWCLSYSLYDEAEAELREVLKRDATNQEARSTLQRLEQLRNPTRPLHRSVEAEEPKTDDGFEMPDAESLGGFSRPVVHEFVSRVQPVLWNKCGNASCHGGSAGETHGFALTPIRSGRSNRIFAERNLAAVLKQIDPATPDRSPLLVTPRGNHGGGKSVFSGYKGGEQFDLLRDWVRQVAGEMRENGLNQIGRPKLAAGAGRGTGGLHSLNEPGRLPNMPSNEVQPAKVDLLRPSVGAVTPASGTAAETDPVKRALEEAQPDPFSPEAFNRKQMDRSDKSGR